MVGAMALTWPGIINASGGTKAVADGLGEAPSTVSGWRLRGIPAPHWAGMVRLAADRGHSDVTLEALANLAARRRLEEAGA